jgi:aspartate aminotransferase
VRTSRDLARWLINECGLAALPGAAFGEVEEEDSISGGSLRLRMATSFLFYPAEDKYQKGYALLEAAARDEEIELPLLDEAINCIQIAVGKLQRAE